MKLAFFLAAVAFLSTPASAQQIVFRHEAVLSGTLAGVPFGPSHVALRGVGDMSTRQTFPNGYFIKHSSATAEIEGLGVFHFVTPTRSFVHHVQQLVGIGRANQVGLDFLDGPFDASFANWDMLSAIGAVTGNGGAINWDLGDIVTSGGVLDVVSGTFPVTFGASPCSSSGTSFCFGDGTGQNCPCGANGTPGAGCGNSTGSGALLTGSGDPCYAIDSLKLEVIDAPDGKPGVLLRGDAQGANPMADGILCTAGSMLRSQVQVTAGGTTLFTKFAGQPFGSVSALGTPTYFQFLYRDTGSSCSGQGFNYSNGWTVTYQL